MSCTTYQYIAMSTSVKKNNDSQNGLRDAHIAAAHLV